MQQPHDSVGASGPSDRRPEHPLVPASRVNGTQVYNREGEKLGKVEDVAIDKVTGQVAYAILSFGGILGMGESYYPVPWKLLAYETRRHGYVIPCEKSQLENAPRFEPHELSGWDDAEIRNEIFAFYGPYGTPPF
jgi:sporulation protein YlmC with PRC-barrel domain